MSMYIKSIEITRPYSYSDERKPLEGKIEIRDDENGINLSVQLSEQTIIAIQELCSGDVKKATGIILETAAIACIPDLLPNLSE